MHQVSFLLLEWYDKNHRNLPWRIPPDALKNGTKPDPYRVWLSEIMLQQTTVEAVKPYFKKFTDLWPNIFALANASQEDILKAWAGLGYYSRARNLKACADAVVARYGGTFPQKTEELQSLVGIGVYTAAAIAAIAFNQSVAVVDGNVARIISRLFAIENLLTRAKSIIKQKTQFLTPKERPGDFAQAMMDLGAKICLPKNPRCLLCPIQIYCRASLRGQPDRFPIKPEKLKRPERVGAAYIILSQDKCVYLEKRNQSGLLGGMTQIPNYFDVVDDTCDKPGCDQEKPSKLNEKLTTVLRHSHGFRQCGQVTHVFTHFTLKLDIYMCENVQEKNIGNGWWCAISDLAKEALPTVMKKAIHKAIPDAFG